MHLNKQSILYKLRLPLELQNVEFQWYICNSVKIRYVTIVIKKEKKKVMALAYLTNFLC